MFVEFDRDPKVKGEEAVDLLREQLQESLASVEIDVKEYTKLKLRLHELEV